MTEQNEYSASSVYDYPFSFSGTDVEAYIIQGTDFYKLNSLSTVSFQVNEQKSPVRRLGYVTPVGFTRAIRTIAGTLVLTVLKDHPLNIVGQDKISKLLDTSNYHPLTFILATGNPKKVIQNNEFDLLLKYQSEGNRRFYSEFKIIGINLISQSMVTSVNDMVTEMVFQFMAKDFEDFKLIENTAQVAEDDKVRKEITNNNINEKIVEIQKKIEIQKALLAANSFADDASKTKVEETLRLLEKELEDLKNLLNKLNSANSNFDTGDK